MMKGTFITFAAVVGFLLASPVFGAVKPVHHEIELNGIRHIDISHSVGNIHIVPATDSNTAQLEATIKGRSKGWFRGIKDVTDTDFVISKRGDTLYIKFDQDNTEATFTLTIPMIEQLSIHLGVGNVSGALYIAKTDINIGVGNADLTASLATTGYITMNTALGHTHVKATQQQNTTRAVVTSSVKARGEGGYPLDVNVGVGNSSLNLTVE